MLGDHRSEANTARNRYRHPVGTLTFLGLEDGMTVMEIWPGGGWYTEVLAPVMRHHGQFIVAGYDVDIPGQPEYRYRLQQDLLDKFSAAAGIYDQVAIVAFSPPESASLGEAGSIDLILTFRNAHGWVSSGTAELIFAEFARVCRPVPKRAMFPKKPSLPWPGAQVCTWKRARRSTPTPQTPKTTKVVYGHYPRVWRFAVISRVKMKLLPVAKNTRRSAKATA